MIKSSNNIFITSNTNNNNNNNINSSKVQSSKKISEILFPVLTLIFFTQNFTTQMEV